MHQIKLLFAFLLASTCAAQSASSDWYETEGGRVRLVSTGAPDGNGTLKAALQVDLEPGWRTYWRDPGDAGVPPQLSVAPGSPVQAIDLQFPPPQRFHEHNAHWAGYDHSVAFPLALTVDPAAQASPLAINVFLGICQTICIPVQTQLNLDPGKRADDMFDRAAVNAAFDALPLPATSSLGVLKVQRAGRRLVLTVADAKKGDALLFLAGDGGYQFGIPHFNKDTRSFEAEILMEPQGRETVRIYYTLSHPDASWDGSFDLLPPS